MNKKIYAALAGLLPLMASAQIPGAPGIGNTLPEPTIKDVGGITGTICTLIAWFFWILIIYSIVMVLLAAWTYISSKGDPKKTEQATSMIKFAIFGVIAALLAKGLPVLVASLLGSRVNFSTC